MIFKIIQDFNNLRFIYKSLNTNITFNEALILYAISNGNNTNKKLNITLFKDKAYITRVLSKLKTKNIIIEKSGTRPKEYIVTNLGKETLTILKTIENDYIIEKQISTDL